MLNRMNSRGYELLCRMYGHVLARGRRSEAGAGLFGRRRRHGGGARRSQHAAGLAAAPQWGGFDALEPRVLLSGDPGVGAASVLNYTIDFNSGVDGTGNSQGDLVFNGPDGFDVLFADDESNGAEGGNAAGVHINSIGYGNAKAGTADLVLGAFNSADGANNYHSSGIVAEFNWGVESVSLDDTDDDTTTKTLFAFDRYGNVIGQTAPGAQQTFTISTAETGGKLIWSVEFDTAAGTAGGSNDGTYFTIDNFVVEGTTPPPMDDVLIVDVYNSSYDSASTAMFNELTAIGVNVTEVELTGGGGQAAAELAANDYDQIWVYDLSSGTNSFTSDWNAIADWFNDKRTLGEDIELITDGRILSSYWPPASAFEARALTENYYQNFRLADGGLMLGTDHAPSFTPGINTINSLIGIDPFTGNFSGSTIPTDTANPLMSFPHMLSAVHDHTSTSQPPSGFQSALGQTLWPVSWHGTTQNNPAISSTIAGAAGFDVEIDLPLPGAQFIHGRSVDFDSSIVNNDGSVDYEWTSDLDGLFGSTASFSISSLSVGTHVIQLFADDTGSAASDADTVTIEILAAPDLVVSAPAGPAAGTAGQAFDFDFRIDNDGTADANGFVGQVLLSSDTTVSGDDAVIADFTDTLAMGAGDDYSFNVALPDVPAGAYHLLFVADPGELIDEESEANNLLTLPITVSDPVTVTATDPTGSTNASVTQVDLTLSGPVDETAANDASSYELLDLGADRQLGGGDDVPLALSPNYLAGSTDVELLVVGENTVDLTAWDEQDYGSGGAGNWTVAGDNLSVFQSINGQPTFFASDFDLLNRTFAGRIQVTDDGGDDDFIGVAFGYQENAGEPDNYYLLYWKRQTQTTSGVTGEEGLKLVKVTNSSGVSEGNMFNAIWDGETKSITGGGQMELLASNLSSTLGWVEGTDYDFKFTYLADGTIDIEVTRTSDGQVFWDTTVVDPSPLGAGKVAFFNESQANVRYSGLQQADVLPDGVYQLTAFAGTPGLVDGNGAALDGDADGLAGTDFVTTFTVDTVAPTVDDVTFGPLGDTIIVTYNDAGGMDPISATDLANYTLVRSGGDGTFGEANDVSVAIDQINFIDAQTVELVVGPPPAVFAFDFASADIAFPGPPDDVYQLTIAGDTSVEDAAGNKLNGGIDEVAEVTRDIAPAFVDLQLDGVIGSVVNTDAPDFRVDVNEPGSVEVDFDGDGTPDQTIDFDDAGFDIAAPASLADGSYTAMATFAAVTPDGSPAIAALPFTVDTIGPSVTSTTIANLEQGDDRFNVSFSEPIDLPSLTTGDLTLVGPDGPVAIDSITAVLGRTDFEVVLDQPLQKAGQYDLTVGPDVEDDAGNTMDQNGDGTQGDAFAGSFGIVDTTPPFVTSFVPTGLLNSDVTQFEVTFSEPMNPATFTGDDLLVTQPDSSTLDLTGVVITGDAANEVFTVTLPAVLSADGDYDVEVGPNITDINGNAMSLVEVTNEDFASDPTGTGGEWGTLGDASWNGGGFLRLTSATSSQVGAAYFGDAQTPAPFIVEFDFNLNSSGGLGGGADGFVFVVAENPVIGGVGAGIGYSGALGTSFAVEFDTFANSGENNNHIALDWAGTFQNTAVSVNGPWMNNSGDHHATIRFDGTSLVTVDLLGPTGQLTTLSANVPLNEIPSQYTFGFTSSTGAGWANHDIDNVSVQLLSGGGSGGAFQTSFTIDQTPPQIDSTTASTLAQGDTSLQFTLSEATTNPLTIGDVSLTDPLGSPVNLIGLTDLGGNVYELTFDGLFTAGDYTLDIANGSLIDAAGNALLPYSEVFPIVDVTPPNVLGFVPTGVLGSDVTQFEVTFDEPIKLTTFTVEDLNVALPDGSMMPLTNIDSITPSVNDTVFTIDLVAPLSADGDYDVEVGPNISDVAGNFMTGFNSFVAYDNDFETGANEGFGSGITGSWSDTSLIDDADTSQFLGNFGNQETVLTLNNLPAHADVTVEFDLLLIDSWDGNVGGSVGPDYFGFLVDSETTPEWEHTFNSFDGNQTYPFEPDFRGVNVIGSHWEDTFYYDIQESFDHTGSTLEIRFRGRGLQELNDESWGVDDVTVTLNTDTGGSGGALFEFSIDKAGPTVENVTIDADTITVDFDDVAGVDPATATDPANYSLVDSGGDGTFGDGNENPIALGTLIDSIDFNPTTQVATLNLNSDLPDEVYQLTVDGTNTVADVFGNPLLDGADFVSGPLAVNAVPAGIEIDLQASSDTGASDSDDITTDTTPTFDVTVTEPGLVEFDGDGDGTYESSTVVTSPTTVSFTSPVLADGLHSVDARLTAIDGGIATDSLTVEIDTVGPQLQVGTTSEQAPLFTRTLSFNESIDPASFVVGDVSFVGPGGVPLPSINAINHLGGGDFELAFNTITNPGTYRFDLAPNLTDLAGNPLNQDGDGNNGETGQDIAQDLFLLIGDATAPQIASHSPEGRLLGPVDTLTVAFDELIDPTTFDVGDINFLLPGGGSIPVGDLTVAPTDLTPQGATTFAIGFPSQAAPGVYTAVIGPDVQDLAGNPMSAAYEADFNIDLSGPVATGLATTGTPNQDVTSVTISFDEPVDPNSAAFGDLTVTDPGGANVAIATVAPAGPSALTFTFAAPQTLPGTYTVALAPVVTDPLGNVMDQDGDGTGGEAAEDVYSDSFVLEQANLQVFNVTPPTGASFGQSVVVSWVGTNAGAVPVVDDRTDSVYLSDNGTFGDGDDVLLGTTPIVGDLNPGEFYTASRTVMLPVRADLGVGSHDFTIFVVADHNGVVTETVENDNHLGAAVSINKPSGPAVVGTPTINGNPDRYLSVAFDGPVDPATLAGAVSFTGPGGPIAITDIRDVGGNTFEFDLGRLGDAGLHTLTIAPTVTSPLGHAMNQDGDATNGEAGDDGFSVAIDVDLPDLIVEQIVAPATATPGGNINVTYRVTNIGDAPAIGDIVEQFRLSGDDNLGGDLDFASVNRSINIPAGGHVDRSITLTLPGALPFAGDLKLVVEADSVDQIDEELETNNTAIDDQPMSVPAELQLSLSRTAADEEDPNGVTGFVTRSGDTSAPLVVNLSSSDIGEATVPTSVTIPADSTTASFPITLPADGVIDGDELVSIEATATDHDPVLIDLTVRNIDRPNLSLSGIPATLTEGQSVTVTVARDFVTADPVTIFLSRSSQAQLAMPAEVEIPANQPSTTFILTATDNFNVEPDQDVEIVASAVGLNATEQVVTVADDDLPTLTMTVLEPSFSESAGLVANAVTITRDTATPVELVVALSDDGDGSELFLPPSVTIPANQASATFSIFALDDAISDGTQTVNLTATPTSTAGLPLTTGIATGSVDVTDDDGDTLTLSITPGLVGEGINDAAEITITRNTDPTNPLTVDLSSSDTSELTVPAQVTIPAGQVSHTFSTDVDSVADGTQDGNQTVTVTVSATGFNEGADSLIVSDANLPDMVIEQLRLVDAGGNPIDTIPTEAFFRVGFDLANRGFGAATFTAPDDLLTVSLFLSQDAVLGNGDDIEFGDPGLGPFSFPGTFNVNDTLGVEVTPGDRSPVEAGDYFLFAVVDVDNNAAETREDNNVTVTAQPITVEAAYSATVETDVTQAIAGQTIPMRGSATNTDGSPAQQETVNIHILVRGTERIITAVTDNNGDFTVDFTPLPNEGGEYTIFATHPGVDAVPVQDSFTVLGLNVIPANPDLTVLEAGSATENLTLRNLSTVPLTSLTATLISKPANMDVSFDFPSGHTLNGLADLPLDVNVTANDASVLSGVVTFRINTTEGPTFDVDLDVSVQPLVSNLVANKAALSTSVLVGGQKLVTFDVSNVGGAGADPTEVILPQGLPSWITLASPQEFNLPAGDTATISLLLTPPDSTSLLPVSSSMFVSGPDGFVTMPFTFRPVSDAIGDVEISVIDELFYFASGSPKVERAQVTLRDNIDRDVIVAQGETGPDGVFRVDDLQEGFYYLQLSEEDHESFSTPIFIEGNQGGDFLNEFEYFLSREFVQYIWTVEEFEFEDRTEITIEATFDTVVPAPSLLVDPTVVSLAPLEFGGDTLQYELNLENIGLTQIEDIQLTFDNHPLYDVQPLTDTIGVLPAQSSISVPIIIERTQDTPVGPCSMFGAVLWSYDAGPNTVNKRTTLRFTNVDGVCPVTPRVPLPAPGPGPATGGGPGGGRPSGIFVPPRPPVIRQPETVNAQVGIEISQDLVLTRQGFDATLELINETDQPLTDISVELAVFDLNGDLANDRFGIADPNIQVISAIDGSGVLTPEATGTVEWILVGRDEAAPDGPTDYFIGGSLSYTTNGEVVEVDLTPVAVTVQPNPQLFLDYFLQRDVYSDDPFTPQTEPAEPFALGVLIRNEGAGDARNLRIESAQPEVVDNAQGLLIDFAIVASQVGNQNLSPSLTLPFGDLAAGGSTVGQWLMEASLHGHFVDYDANFTHTNPFGIEDISPVKEVEIHEMLFSFQATGSFDDDLPDFLVNDVPDTAGTPMRPETAYLSDGTTEPVAQAQNIVASGNVALGNLSVTVTATTQPGFNYFRFPDPGQGDFRVVSVQRSDGSFVPLDNIRQTDRTFLAVGQRPVYEDILHMIDNDSTGSYTITYEPNDSQGPQITVLEPDPDVRVDPVQSLTIQFSEPVVDFDKDDLTLERNDVELPLDGLVLTQISPTEYELNGGGLESLTDSDGTYRLTVDNAGITDDIGNVAEAPGVGTWVKQGDVPEIVEVSINDGLQQRSTLVNIALTFNTGLNFQELIDTDQIADEVQVVNADNPAEVLDLDSSNFAWDPVNFKLTIDLTVDGVGGSERSTVPEGNYRIELNTFALSTDFGTHLGDQGDSQNDGTAVRDRSTGAGESDLYRLPGDTDGDRDIDLLNLRDYRSLIGSFEGDGTYQAEYDLDADGDIDRDDFLLARDALASRRGR